MLRFLARILGRKPTRRTGPGQARQQVRLSVEELMPRVLPSVNLGSAAAAGGAGHRHNHALFSDSSTSSGDAGSQGAAHHSCGGAASNHGASLAATLSNSTGATGQALFNSTTGKLTVQVQGADANASLDVAVDGTSVGTLTTDASGSGKLSVTEATDAIQAGATITAGDLQGTFAPVSFSASLTGDSGASGVATFNSLKNLLLVSITGAAANTIYNVTVDSTAVGQLTTNSAGAGKLKIAPSGVTIQDGSMLAVSDTAGRAPILQ